MKTETLVSVIITNYNYGQFLPAAIESVRGQNYPNIELVVVDDGSTDNSHEILRQYGKLITPIFQEHAGQVAGFNAGFSASKGDIIAFLDADDAFMPDKMDWLLQVFEAFPAAGWCFHRLKVVDNKGDEIRLTPEIPNGCVDFREQIIRGKVVQGFSATSSLCFRRTTLEKFFPMPVLDENRGVFIDDGYLKTLAMSLTPGYSINEPLGMLRLHSRNRQSGRPDAILQAIKRNIWLAYLLVSRHSQFSRYSIIFASRAIGRGWRIGWGYSPQEKKILLSYWKKLDTSTRFILMMRVIAYIFVDILKILVEPKGA